MDPLAKKYAYYSPYQFAGNMPIWAIDLDGLEPGVIIGNDGQIQAVNQFNSNVNKENQNWTAFKNNGLVQAKIDLQNHKKLGNKIYVLLIQAHAGAGEIKLFPGPDGKLDVEGVVVGAYIPQNDDGSLSGFQMGAYINQLAEISMIKNPKKREKALKDYKTNEEAQKIDQFLDVVSEIENGGTLILNACHVFAEHEGRTFSENILTLTGKKLTVIGAQDFVRDSDGKDAVLNGTGFISAQPIGNAGYMRDSQGTGHDLKLNGTGELIYDFIPIKL
jgi:hypothetical protein